MATRMHHHHQLHTSSRSTPGACPGALRPPVVTPTPVAPRVSRRQCQCPHAAAHQHQHATSDARPQQQQQQQQQPGADDASLAPCTSGQQQQTADLLTFAEVQHIAAVRGMHVDLKTLGPLYRITCRDGGPDGRILGTTEGFTASLFGLMHCDTLQIFTRGMVGDEGARVRRNALGLGLLLGAAVFSHGAACGCRKAEILAINDEDAWHERLVRYYSYFGFTPVCKVGGRGFFQDVPHLLVWGGEGTRMDADVDAALRRWTPALRKSIVPKQQPAAAAAATGDS